MDVQEDPGAGFSYLDKHTVKKTRFTLAVGAAGVPHEDILLDRENSPS